MPTFSIKNLRYIRKIAHRGDASRFCSAFTGMTIRADMALAVTLIFAECTPLNVGKCQGEYPNSGVFVVAPALHVAQAMQPIMTSSNCA
ncbi:hypothetical protein [Dyella choica]|uniref:Uncharacterized protein n=1 Tax=Dyella choica TaxID=1927959 RepID=A0A432LZW2_9GAMM|nr:hypothetical protein [Dyella choica]RUL69511.1 hypothetical protein EKH80_22075 [Dyella choica]